MGVVLKIVVSDLHMGPGYTDGQPNPFEDFNLDDRLVELLEYYTSGEHAGKDVELILNGDIFDLLKVAIDGKFVDEISEDISMNKLRICMDGHPVVVDGFRKFISEKNRRITYIPGNHDIDFFYSGVRHLFCGSITGKNEDSRIRFITDGDRYNLPGGVSIMHGHQYEPIHSFNYNELFDSDGMEKPVLNLPWGSYYVLNVICPLKEERPYIDHVRPFYPFIMFGLITDFRFAVRVLFRSFYYFLRTRMFRLFNRRTNFRKFFKILGEDLGVLHDLERFAERTLKSSMTSRLVIMGHTHQQLVRTYGPDRTYMNTGSWTRIVNLSLGSMSSQLCPAYVLIEYDKDKPKALLLEWKGVQRQFEKITL